MDTFLDTFHGSTFNGFFWFDHHRLVNEIEAIIIYITCAVYAGFQNPFQCSRMLTQKYCFPIDVHTKYPWNPLNGGMHAIGRQWHIFYAF